MDIRVRQLKQEIMDVAQMKFSGQQDLMKAIIDPLVESISVGLKRHLQKQELLNDKQEESNHTNLSSLIQFLQTLNTASPHFASDPEVAHIYRLVAQKIAQELKLL
jgi:hypothetical protein